MSIFDDDKQMNDIDISVVKHSARSRAVWKDYSIYVLPNSHVKIFMNESPSGVRELDVTPELLKELFQAVGLEYDSGFSIKDATDSLIAHINSASVTKVVRTIHPVGQGAFYSERFLRGDGNTAFLAVYDCGAQKTSVVLKREIASSFSMDDEIDVLFISHLDNDHVCGIPTLKKSVKTIKTVVLPLIPASTKPIYLLMADSTLTQILTKPQDFFRGSKIVYVNSVDEDVDNTESLALPYDNDDDIIVGSGTRMYVAKFKDWCYVPYNYDADTLIKAFREELVARGVQISDMIDLNSYPDRRTEFRDIYSKVCAKHVNDSSLVVYSGGLNSDYSSKHIYMSECRSSSSGEGCLYYGDANLNRASKMNIPMVYNIASRLLNYNLNCHIGTIQLPHHGANGNFNVALLTFGQQPKVYFASHGEINNYGHPSTAVIGQILANNESYYGVTERRYSALRQIINL